ncbi:MAG: BppU family phage baseplate upper protein [Gordonibacter sp.]|uniref:BppU family phage baseplate upper protein n=1 Tax=Gordonibacter sp. TaxID=1968902 RepID=UPI002FC792C2
MNTQTLELDISKRGGGQCVTIGQGDKSGTTIEAYVYDNGAPVALADYTVQLVARLPDRVHYARAGTATVSSNVITCTVDESKLASVAGYTDEAYFVIIKGDVEYSTERFALDIKRSALDGQAPAQSWDNMVDALIKQGENAIDEITGTNSSVENNEKKRIEAEASRVKAESSRQSSETLRGKEFSSLKLSSEESASCAIASAETASRATKNADTAAKKADASKTAADEATVKANAAATDALAAAEEARGSISPDKKVYITYDTVGDTDYLTIIDAEA